MHVQSAAVHLQWTWGLHNRATRSAFYVGDNIWYPGEGKEHKWSVVLMKSWQIDCILQQVVCRLVISFFSSLMEYTASEPLLMNRSRCLTSCDLYSELLQLNYRTRDRLLNFRKSNKAASVGRVEQITVSNIFNICDSNVIGITITINEYVRLCYLHLHKMILMSQAPCD